MKFKSLSIRYTCFRAVKNGSLLSFTQTFKNLVNIFIYYYNTKATPKWLMGGKYQHEGKKKYQGYYKYWVRKQWQKFQCTQNLKIFLPLVLLPVIYGHVSKRYGCKNIHWSFINKNKYTTMSTAETTKTFNSSML